jgi:nucleotide-binding universal stress UspA family protein
MTSTVVVAYSPDEYGEAALEAGAEEAGRRGVPLVVVNATRGDAYVDPHFADADTVARLRERLGEVEVLQEVVSDVGGEVVRVAEERDAELVVVGIRHRSPVGKALMGSVSQRILLDARCPVLAVKPRG